MKEALKSIARKVTLELIYQVVDERTEEINKRLDRLEIELKDIRSEIRALNARIDQLFSILISQKTS